jgi:hypothetical protein
MLLLPVLKRVRDCNAGEHTHTIVGYSLIKGIGDGEPIASERFSVGGHEWVSDGRSHKVLSQRTVLKIRLYTPTINVERCQGGCWLHRLFSSGEARAVRALAHRLQRSLQPLLPLACALYVVVYLFAGPSVLPRREAQQFIRPSAGSW